MCEHCHIVGSPWGCAAPVRLVSMPERATLADTVFLRALQGVGRPVVNHVEWVLPQPVSLDELVHVERRLATGMLGRRLVRPLVPGARWRWVQAWDAPGAGITTEGERLGAVSDGATSFDPRTGPAYRVTAEQRDDGRGVVRVAAAHLVADGSALLEEVAAALHARPGVVTEPLPGVGRRLVQDAEDAVSQLRVALPWLARSTLRGISGAMTGARRSAMTSAAKGVVQRACPGTGADLDVQVGATSTPGTNATPLDASPDEAAEPRGRRQDEAGWQPPSVRVRVPRAAWDAAWQDVPGASANALFVAWVRRLLPDAGEVALAVPVSTRAGGDSRGNATRIAVVRLGEVTAADLPAVRAGLRDAYRATDAEPAIPREVLQLVPPRLLRLLPQPPAARAMASSLGFGPAGLNEVDGQRAEAVWTYAAHLGLTAADARRVGAGVAAWHSRVGDDDALWVTGVDPDLFTTPGDVAAAARRACRELGVDGAQVLA